MINLLYCGNDKVFDGMMISLLSIMKHTTEPIHVYVMTMDLREIDEKNRPVTTEQTTYLLSMLREKNPESTMKLIDITEMFKADMIDSPNLKNFYTPYTLVRLYADLVEGLPDKLLYLDTDTVANKDISPIFDIDIEGYEFAGVIDYLGKIFIRYNYMNAGILYLNLPQIKKTGVFLKSRQMCKNKKMFFPDQTALNRAVLKKKFIPVRYNEQRKLRKNTVIQHFCKSIRLLPYYHTVNIKPWQVEDVRSIYKIHAYDDILDDYLRRKRLLS
jgi:lipopolysaccharide biosynthesis glycosyltransferase